MNNYELTLVLPGGVSAAKKKSILAEVEKIINTADGKIEKADEWGKLDLAYKIKKESEGLFIYMAIVLSPETAKNLKEKLRINDDIIRYLLVRV